MTWSSPASTALLHAYCDVHRDCAWASPKAENLPWLAAAAAGLDSTFDPTAAINAAITQAAQANGNAAVNNAAVRKYGMLYAMHAYAKSLTCCAVSKAFGCLP